MKVTKQQISFIETQYFYKLKSEHEALMTFLTTQNGTEETKEQAKRNLMRLYRESNDFAGIDAFLRLVYIQQRRGNFSAAETLKKGMTQTKKDFNDTLRMIDRLNELKEICPDADVNIIDQIIKLF